MLGLLVFLLIRVMRQSSSDRGDYQQQLNTLREAHAVQLREITARYDGLLNSLEHRIEVLEAQLADVRQQVELERKARWEAEDAAARYRREQQHGPDPA